MRLIDVPEGQVREVPTLWIPMADGCRLAARVWLPEGAEAAPVPAVLEYLPYRRRDGTAARDLVTQPWLALHGYAAVRLDVRGTGDSEGVMRDEYDLPEVEDGAAAVEWIARQPWCSGKVGMWGLSWGGFNSLQVAARRPPSLAAIMPMGFGLDRFNGDCHFMGGCLAEGNVSWGHTLFVETARPPDPAVVGEAWRAMWQERLEALEHPVATWLSHQRRDAYWRPGSVGDDLSRIEVPVYAVSGWQDSYARSVLPLLEGLRGPRKGLIGPWAHTWPHWGRPGPAIGFLQEALRWWDHWLKGHDTGIMDEPMLRAWMLDAVAPSRHVAEWPGRWVQEAAWPPGREALSLTLGPGGLGGEGEALDRLVSSPADTGLAAGYQCSYGIGPDLAGDQGPDDARSACFDTPPLPEDVEILGEPALDLVLSSDRPQAQVAVRLCAVAPDGASLRITYGMLNLSHRDGPEAPAPMIPGARAAVSVPLLGIAQRVPAGHRLRVAVSTAYWPVLWPAPAPVALTLHRGRLRLPVREPQPADAALAPFGAPEGARADVLVETRPRPVDLPLDELSRDPATGVVTLSRTRDRGAWRTTDTDVATDATGLMRFAVHPDDPATASQHFTLTETLGRDGWRSEARGFTRLTCTADAFRLEAAIDVSLNDEPVCRRTWSRTFPRDHQ